MIYKKIKNGMEGVLWKWLCKIDKVVFGDTKCIFFWRGMGMPNVKLLLLLFIIYLFFEKKIESR